VQTNNDPHWVKTRHHHIKSTGFKVALEEEESNENTHGGEIVGWIAMTFNNRTTGLVDHWNTHHFHAGITPKSITNAWTYLPFLSGFTKIPNFLGVVGSYAEDDSSYVQVKFPNTNGIYIRVQEDTTTDGETTHLPESVNFLAIDGSGLLSAVDVACYQLPTVRDFMEQAVSYQIVNSITIQDLKCTSCNNTLTWPAYLPRWRPVCILTF
jgi:hypothetical protein